MKYEAILTSALFLALTDAAPGDYGYQKGLRCRRLFQGPLTDKFAGAIGKGPIGYADGPLKGPGYAVGPLKGPFYDGVGHVGGGFGPGYDGVGHVGGFGPGPVDFGVPGPGPFLKTPPALVKRGLKVC
jgi:hypothetical protein